MKKSEQIKEFQRRTEVMTHYTNGGKIETLRQRSGDWIPWNSWSNPCWNWKIHDYRIKEEKPEPQASYDTFSGILSGITLGQGLQRMLKINGEMKVTANGKSVTHVWDYANDKAMLKSEMTKEMFAASERAKWMQMKEQLNKPESMKNEMKFLKLTKGQYEKLLEERVQFEYHNGDYWYVRATLDDDDDFLNYGSPYDLRISICQNENSSLIFFNNERLKELLFWGEIVDVSIMNMDGGEYAITNYGIDEV